MAVAKHRKTNVLRDPVNPLPPGELVDWFRDRLLEWAATNGRDFPWRHTSDEYRIVVTEILLQQTTAATVAKAWSDLFTRYPSWQALHAADVAELQCAIAHLGLGRQRAKRLKALAAYVAANGWQLPGTREELESVPGIGQYVASGLLAVKYGQPEPMLDVNMARVLERFFGMRELADIRDDPWLQTVARRFTTCAEDGWAMLDFAALSCVATRPVCATCPLSAKCRSEVNGD